MSQSVLHVHNLPQQIAAEELAGHTVVVVDVLRASSTICQALASGATEVVPFLEVEDALAAAAVDRANVVLGGERGGCRIDGFDLGNSPSEYTPDSVGGRRVFLTTTNGTRALHHARAARRVVLGAIVNLSAVVASVRSEPRIDILCAGTDGRETSEDILTAGAIVHHIRELTGASPSLNAAAEVARVQWEDVLSTAQQTGRSRIEQLALEFKNSPGGRNLIAIGLEHDLIDCAQIDKLNIVPELDVHAWRIR